MVLSREELVKNDLTSTLICCKNYARSLGSVLCERNKILNWFKELCELFTEAILLISDYNKSLKEKLSISIQNTLLLYLTQLLTAISLLINIFVKEEEIEQVLIEVRNSVTKQIVCCLDGIDAALTSKNPIVDPSGSFVKWMDASLDKLAEVDVYSTKKMVIETCGDAEKCLEEVLSHAMSIAQVSLPIDSKIIRGSCQSVLDCLNSLTKETHNLSMNGAMVNLFADACSDKLCLLERKVNTAVLKLCLKTFSEFTQPLQQIHDFCLEQKNKGKVEELDGLVADFDLHVDRIMQIGLFSVSCSNDLKRGIKIRSCLASLEALESELVPALTSVLLDKSIHNENCAILLMKHWLNQANTLQHLIYLIIDPFAFSQIIYEEASDIVENLSLSLIKEKSLSQKNLKDLLQVVDVLKNFLDIAQTEFDQDDIDTITSKLKDFNNVLLEVHSASKVLLKKDKSDFESSSRVLKRCKILLTVMKRLWYCFADPVENNKNTTISNDKILLPKLENLQIEPTGNVFLDHIIKRGKQILQERSVLYRTPVPPKNNVSFERLVKTNPSTKKGPKNLPLSRLVHFRKLSFLNTSARNDNLDLQITDILGEMTNLSTTFHRV